MKLCTPLIAFQVKRGSIALLNLKCYRYAYRSDSNAGLSIAAAWGKQLDDATSYW
jgi:hypothetical protein